MPERLHKIIAQAGITSRRKAEQLIQAGRVAVNGRVANVGETADLACDTVTIDGKKIDRADLISFAFHKPFGVVTTMHDTLGHPAVGDYCRDLPIRVYPVGRLDADTTGLLLLTNDGDLAQCIMHPSFEINKTYHVTVDGKISQAALTKLTQGIALKEGTTAPAAVSAVEFDPQRRQSTLWITIHEGWNRQVRRMFGRLGLPVVALARTQIGPILLGDLASGLRRPLTTDELLALTKRDDR